MTAKSNNVLRLEFNWLLTEEVSSILNQLKAIIQICVTKFKLCSGDESSLNKGNNFLLSLPNSDAIKGLINVVGDSVMKAELKFMFPKFGHPSISSFIFEQCPWKLHQLQEAHNHLLMAMEEILERESCGEFTSGEQVEELMDKIMVSMNRAKTCLLVPEKMSLIDHINSPQQKVMNPPIPEELVMFFNVNCDKLILCVYVLNHLTTNHNQKATVADHLSIGYQFESNGKWFEIVHKAEIICSISWLKDLIVWINTSQQLCQQLKDKITIFHSLLPDLLLQKDLSV